MSLKFVVISLVVAAAIAQQTFVNDWEDPVHFKCPKNTVITSVYSIHDNAKEDRRWRFGCGPTPGNVKPNNCYWTDEDLNDWDLPVMFMCRPNFMIAGIESEFDKDTRDRRLKVRCCGRYGVKTRSCSTTVYLNDFDSLLNYTVSSGNVLTGWLSHHDNYSEDRRHKMIECALG